MKRLFIVAEIDDSEKFTFKWDKTIDQASQITMILQAAQFLDEETVTRMLLEAMGKIDIVDEVLERKEADAMEQMQMQMAMMGGGEADAEAEMSDKYLSEFGDDVIGMLEGLLEGIES